MIRRDFETFLETRLESLYAARFSEKSEFRRKTLEREILILRLSIDVDIDATLLETELGIKLKGWIR